MDCSKDTESATLKFPRWPCEQNEIFMPLFSIDFGPVSHRKTAGKCHKEGSRGLSAAYFPNTIDGIIEILGSNDLIGLHNARRHEVKDIVERLNANAVLPRDEWEYAGIPREDEELSVEYSPVLYRPSVWQLNGWVTYWSDARPELSTRSQDLGRPFTVGCFRNRQTGANLTSLNAQFNRIYSAEALKLAVAVLEERPGVGQRNRLLRMQDKACSPSIAASSDPEVSEDICQFLTDHFIPYYDALLQTFPDRKHKDPGSSLKADTLQRDLSDAVVSLEQDHKTAKINQRIADGFDQGVCHAKDSPLLSPHGFEFLANTSGEGMCYWKDAPAITDVNLLPDPSSWGSSLTTSHLLGIGVIGLCIAGFAGFAGYHFRQWWLRRPATKIRSD